MSSSLKNAAIFGSAYQVLNSFLFVVFPNIMMGLIHSSIGIQVFYVGLSFVSFSAITLYFLQFPVAPIRPWAKFPCTLLMFFFGVSAFFMLVDILVILLHLNIGTLLFASRFIVYLPLLTAIALIYFLSKYSKNVAGLSDYDLYRLKMGRYFLYVPVVLAAFYILNRYSSSPLSEWIYNNKLGFNHLSSLLAFLVLTLFLFWYGQYEEDSIQLD